MPEPQAPPRAYQPSAPPPPTVPPSPIRTAPVEPEVAPDEAPDEDEDEIPEIGEDDGVEVIDRIDEPDEDSKRRRLGSEHGGDDDVATAEEPVTKRQRPGIGRLTWADETDVEDQVLGIDRDYRM